MPESQLLNIDFGSTLARMVEIRNEAKALRAENELLKKAIEGDAEALFKLDKSLDEANQSFVQNEAHIKALSREQRTLNKVVEDTIKVQNSQRGSIAANRAELSRLTQEYIKLGNPTKEQTERIKNLSDTLKLQEATIGDTRRNVGNYGEAISQAFGGLKVFGVEVSQVSGFLRSKQNELKTIKTALNSTSTATGGVTQSFKLMKTALASIGIGLAVAAIGLLIENWEAISDAIGMTNKHQREFNKLKAEGLTKYQDEITKIQLLKTEYEQTNTAQERRAEIITELKETAPAYFSNLDTEKTSVEDLTVAYAKYAQALKLKGTIEILSQQISQNNAQKIQNENKEVSEQLTLQDKIIIGYKQFLGFNTLAVTALEAQAKAAENTSEANEELTATNEKLEQALIELFKLQDEAGGDPEKQNERIKNQQEQSKKLASSSIKDEQERQKNLEKVRSEALSKQLNDERLFTENQLISEGEAFANAEITKEEFEKRKQEILELSLENQIVILETFGQEVADKEIELQNLVLDNEIANREKSLEHQEGINERIKEINQDLADAEQEITEARQDIAQNAFDTISGLAKEGSNLQKAAFLGSQGAAVADVIISTQERIAAIDAATALQSASAAVLPFPANLAAEAAITAKGLAKRILAGIQGGITIAKIAGTTIKGFLAEGGELTRLDNGGKIVHIGGRSHIEGGTEISLDGVPVAIAERDEKMFILKKDASQHIESYSRLNQMFGGRSWTGRPVHHAALGGSVASTFDGGFTARQSRDAVETRLALQTLRNMPVPIVKVSEINRVNKGAQQAVKVSEL